MEQSSSFSSSPSLMDTGPAIRVGVLADAFRTCLTSSGDDICLDSLLTASRTFEENMRAVGQHGNARDMRQNIGKVEQSRARAPVEQRQTMKALLQYEKVQGARPEEGGRLREDSAAMGLLWMRRAVAFQHRFNLSLADEPDLPTVDAALQAYNLEIQPFHSWPLQQIFTLAFCTTTPGRGRALAELWGAPDITLTDAQEEIIIENIRYLAGIWKALLETWRSLFEELDLEDPGKA